MAFFLLSTLQEKEAEEQRRLTESPDSLENDSNLDESLLARLGYHNGVTESFSESSQIGTAKSDSFITDSNPNNDQVNKDPYEEKMSPFPSKDMEYYVDGGKTEEDKEDKLAKYKPGVILSYPNIFKEVEKIRHLSQMIEEEDKKDTNEDNKDDKEDSIEGVSLVIEGASDTKVLSAFKGGAVSFLLNAGLNNRGREYLVLGSLSGTYPGSALPNKELRLPLNWDFFTETVIASVEAGSPFFFSFHGYLDEKGCADALFCTAGALPMEFANQSINFAYLLLDRVDFVSNPVSILLTQ